MSTSQSQSLHPINGHDPFTSPLPPPVPDNGFPIQSVAILGITVAAFLLVSYYIFVTRGCSRWQLSDPLGRFTIRLSQPNEARPSSGSPSWQSRGLNELLIRDIPTVRYNKQESASAGPSKCAVCLNEFRDRETLRVLPKCSHAFHLDCIDVWLLSSPNCPLCRSAISGRNRYSARPDTIIAPNFPPQPETDEEFVEIVMSGGDEANSATGGDSRRFSVRPRSHSSRKFEAKGWRRNKGRKFRRVPIMGDEGIDVGEEDDDRFRVEPIRRSFSMDSVAGRPVYLSVEEIIKQNRVLNEADDDEESGSISKRSIFSFRHGRDSRNAVELVRFNGRNIEGSMLPSPD